MKKSRRDTHMAAVDGGAPMGARIVALARLAAALHMAETGARMGADSSKGGDAGEIRWRAEAERAATQEARA